MTGPRFGVPSDSRGAGGRAAGGRGARTCAAWPANPPALKSITRTISERCLIPAAPSYGDGTLYGGILLEDRVRKRQSREIFVGEPPMGNDVVAVEQIRKLS